CVRHNFDYW
nr:immunoglobulin heavy chain junction region [Mus musculus]